MHCPHPDGPDVTQGLAGVTPMFCCRCGVTWKVPFTIEKVAASQHGPYLKVSVKAYTEFDLNVECIDETKLDLTPKLSVVPRKAGKVVIPADPPKVVIPLPVKPVARRTRK